MTAASTLFDRGGWWDPGCRAFASLRAVSEFRLGLLQRWLPDGGRGLSIVDLGCGGGLLGLPLAAAGARVLGVDIARAALAAGSRRAEGAFQAVAGDLLCPPVVAGAADAVLLADVLEHVDDPCPAVVAAAALVQPAGHVFVNTISRTLRSLLLAIGVAEGFGFVPRGTHRWRRFVKPGELDEMAAAAGLVRIHRIGEAPRLVATLRTGAIRLRESRSLALGYAALYRRVA